MSGGIRSALLVVALAALCAHASAQNFTLPEIIASNMVLQRAPARARLWGWGYPSSVVRARISSGADYADVSATVDSAGAWELSLPPQDDTRSVYSIEIFSDESKVAELDNILYGDVWLCSGQSNMEMTTAMVYDGPEEVEDSANYPDVRVFSVLRNAQSSPVETFAHRGAAAWSESSPSAIGGANYDYFSATCYFFGRENLVRTGIPQGLVSSSWGGTIVEAWMRPEAIATCARRPQLDHVAKKDDVAGFASSSVDVNADPNDHSALWNGMIHPIRKYTFIGAAWYQGESNASDPEGYACLFPAMISDWRIVLESPLFFYFVQLAPYAGSGRLPALRQAQTAALALPDTGMAVTIELWDPTSPHGEIHPRGKQPVGLRLSLNALRQYYAIDVDPLGPTPDGAPRCNGTVCEILFASLTAPTVDLVGADQCTECCTATPFQTQSRETNSWTDAAVEGVAGTTVTIRATTEDPIAVRYAWEDIPQCVVMDMQGLPAAPFAVYAQ